MKLHAKIIKGTKTLAEEELFFSEHESFQKQLEQCFIELCKKWRYQFHYGLERTQESLCVSEGHRLTAINSWNLLILTDLRLNL